MFKATKAHIASAGRSKPFRKALPPASTFQKQPAEYRDITVRNKVNKEKSKSDEENFDHVQTLETVLQPLLDKYTDNATDLDLFWNIDETAIDCEYAEKQKVVCSSDGNSCGLQSSSASSRTGVHVIADVASSESGKTAPPLFIVAGKHHMLWWTGGAPS